MRRMLLATLIAGTLGVPAAALAKQATGMNTNNLQTNGTQDMRDRRMRPYANAANGPGQNTIGAGMDAGSIDGHTTGPGNSPIDNSVRGPINDVQPGHGTSDTLQNRAPRPVRELPSQ